VKATRSKLIGGCARVLAAAVLLVGAGQLHADPAPVQFRGLTVCPEDSCLVFEAADDITLADTLSLDPGTGRLRWVGGPVRGLAAAGDTVLAATRLGEFCLAGDGDTAFAEWETPWLEDSPSEAVGFEPPPPAWPNTRTQAPRPRRSATQVGPAVPFPERYFPLADGTLLFLVDAEHPVRPDRRMVDLHARLTDGVEWELARNLEVRCWVHSSDSLSWAMAALIHVADYGGGTRDVVLAGRGGNVQTFEVGDPRALLWQDGGLWVLNMEGRLNHIAPSRGPWSVEPVELAGAPCACPPGPDEGVWTWSSPALSRTPEQAETRVQAGLRVAGTSLAGWVAPVPGGFVPCWGGSFSREGLTTSLATPPEAGAEPRPMPVTGSTFRGPVTRVTAPALGGVATLRRVGPAGQAAGELWWRFTGGGAAVRVAGPWGR